MTGLSSPYYSEIKRSEAVKADYKVDQSTARILWKKNHLMTVVMVDHGFLACILEGRCKEDVVLCFEAHVF